jgi:hypothetical protein
MLWALGRAESWGGFENLWRFQKATTEISQKAATEISQKATTEILRVAQNDDAEG